VAALSLANQWIFDWLEGLWLVNDCIILQHKLKLVDFVDHIISSLQGISKHQLLTNIAYTIDASTRSISSL
jgi:hypothetical protein